MGPVSTDKWPSRRTQVIRAGDKLITVKPVAYAGSGGFQLRLPAGWRYVMAFLDPWIVWQPQGDGSVVIRPLSEAEYAALQKVLEEHD